MKHRNSAFGLSIVSCSLLVGVAAAGWDYLSWVDVVPESRWDILDLAEEGIISGRTAQALLIMTDEPMDLTGAPPEMLRTRADMWLGEAERVTRRARAEGWFENLAAAARESGLTPPELRRLRLWAEEPCWEPAALVRPPAVSGDVRAEVELDPEGRSDPEGLLRSRTTLWESYHAGALGVEDDEGGSALRKYYVGIEPSDALLQRAVVGTYRASFGEGLVLNTYRRGSHGLFYDTIKERRYRGAAFTSAAGPIEWTVLYSREKPAPGEERERVWGGNVQGALGPGWRLGATYCRTDNGSTLDNIGAYWRGRAGSWYVLGELAATANGDPGAFAEVQRTWMAVDLRASFRHYGRDFDAPQGAPFADPDGTPDASDETGFYVEAKTGARGWYGLRGSCDVWGDARMDAVRAEGVAEGVVWHGGWELSARAAHRRGQPDDGEQRTTLSSRLRRGWGRVVAEAYGRAVEPNGLGHVQLSGSADLGLGLAVGAKSKIDLGRRVGGRSWHELRISKKVWGRVAVDAAHRLGWERVGGGHHFRWQVLRAEMKVAF
jgi:hypothetical protein